MLIITDSSVPKDVKMGTLFLDYSLTQIGLGNGATKNP